MISRQYAGISIPPELDPFGIAFHIYLDKAVSFIYISKCFFIAFTPHYRPVVIMKGIIFVDALECEAKGIISFLVFILLPPLLSKA